MMKNQAWVAGPPDVVAERLAAYADAGMTHLVLRFTCEHERQLEALAGVRATLGW
jgi:hypothetical protein